MTEFCIQCTNGKRYIRGRERYRFRFPRRLALYSQTGNRDTFQHVITLMKENSFAHGNLRVPHIIVAADLKPMILIFHYKSGPRRVTREPLHLNARQFPWLTGDRNVPIVFSLPGFQPRLRPSRTTGKLLRWNIFASMLATNNGNEELKSSFAEIRVRSALKV